MPGEGAGEIRSGDGGKTRRHHRCGRQGKSEVRFVLLDLLFFSKRIDLGECLDCLVHKALIFVQQSKCGRVLDMLNFAAFGIVIIIIMFRDQGEIV